MKPAYPCRFTSLSGQRPGWSRCTTRAVRRHGLRYRVLVLPMRTISRGLGRVEHEVHAAGSDGASRRCIALVSGGRSCSIPVDDDNVSFGRDPKTWFGSSAGSWRTSMPCILVAREGISTRGAGGGGPQVLHGRPPAEALGAVSLVQSQLQPRSRCQRVRAGFCPLPKRPGRVRAQVRCDRLNIFLNEATPHSAPRCRTNSGATEGAD
jgi:hypothetical protein